MILRNSTLAIIFLFFVFVLKAQDKTAIIYLSRTQNTKVFAEIIQKEVGGDLISLELEQPYPKDYKTIVAQVAQENASGFLPPLKTKVDLTKYDTIFLGFPTWGMQLPPPMKSFLAVYDLEGKTVIPFNTNAGYGLGSSISDITKGCNNCNLLTSYSANGGIERDGILFVMKGEKREKVSREIKEWLKSLKLK